MGTVANQQTGNSGSTGARSEGQDRPESRDHRNLRSMTYEEQVAAVTPEGPAGPLTADQVKAAIEWNGKKSKIPAAVLPAVRRHFGLEPAGGYDEALVQQLAQFQQTKGLGVDGQVGTGSVDLLRWAVPELKAAIPLDTLEQNIEDAREDWTERAKNTKLGGDHAKADVAQKLLNDVLARIAEKKDQVDQIARQADLPKEMVAAIWMREDNAMRTTVYLHNGDPLGQKVTHEPLDVPLFRKDQFVEAAVHAFRMKIAAKEQLGLGYGSTDVGAMAAYAERYNGFGYRGRQLTSAYVAAGTDQYEGGMYTGDGKFSKETDDQRLGVLAVILGLQGKLP